ncbi:MAG: polysaccharide deacetylase family protein [Pseudomonadota bacterium]
MALDRSFFKAGALAILAVFGWLRIKLTAKPTLIILTYHRVLPSNDPQRRFEQSGMVTTPEALQEHIKLITGLGAQPVHLEEWIEQNRQGNHLPPLAVAFTFDDGWRDNYEHAYPVLHSHQIPFTVFLVSKLIDTNKIFWPEQVLLLLMAQKIPWEDECFRWLIPFISAVGQEPTHFPFDPHDADRVIGELKRLDDETIYKNLALIYESHPHLAPAPDSRAILNSSEIEEMASSGLARYGAHTRHHYRLNRLTDESQLEAEILDCMNDIKALSSAHVSVFCYPNGDITHKGQQLVRAAYEAACTTKTGWNRAGCDPYDLQRFNLHDGNSFSPQRLLATIGRGLL